MSKSLIKTLGVVSLLSMALPIYAGRPGDGEQMQMAGAAVGYVLRAFYNWLRPVELPVPVEEVVHGNGDTVELLLNYRADINMQNNQGQRVVDLALGNQDQERVRLLLNYNHGDTALHYAVQNWRTIELVELLLNHGADINIQNNDGWTPLHVAILEGLRDIVELLLNRGADMNILNNEGNTALHMAVEGHDQVDYNILQLLLNHWVRNNVLSRPILSFFQNREIGHRYSLAPRPILLINIQNNTGDTSLHHAVQHGTIESVELLLNHGADINIQNNADQTVLDLALVAKDQHNCSVVNLGLVKLLLINGVKVNAYHRYLLLFMVMQMQNLELVEWILNYKPEIGFENIDFLWFICLSTNNVDIVQLLLKHHLPIGDSSVMVSAIVQNYPLEIIQLLLNHGANINVQDRHGNTPLHGAIANNDLELVNFLLDRGADVNIENNNQQTAWYRAATMQNPDIVYVLVVKRFEWMMANCLYHSCLDVNNPDNNFYYFKVGNSQKIMLIILNGKTGVMALYVNVADPLKSN